MTDSWAVVYRLTHRSIGSSTIVQAHEARGAFKGGDSCETTIGNFSVHTFSWEARPNQLPRPRNLYLHLDGTRVTTKHDWPLGAIERSQICSRIENRTGHWNEVFVSPAELIAYSSASGFRPVFYYSDHSCVIIGTNPAAIRDSLGIAPDTTGLAAAYLISTTQVPAEINLYPGIRRIPLGAYLRVSPEAGLSVVNSNANIFTPPRHQESGGGARLHSRPPPECSRARSRHSRS